MFTVEAKKEWKDIDKQESTDPLYSSEYAPEIYTFMKQREVSEMPGALPCFVEECCMLVLVHIKTLPVSPVAALLQCVDPMK